MKLSVVIPVCNEEATIAAVIERVHSVSLPVDREVIVVNDGRAMIKWQDGIVAVRVLFRYRLVPFNHIVRDGSGADGRFVARADRRP